MLQSGRKKAEEGEGKHNAQCENQWHPLPIAQATGILMHGLGLRTDNMEQDSHPDGRCN
jgi:hypothetical protein